MANINLTPVEAFQTIDRPSRDMAQAVLGWVGTNDVRPPDARAYTHLNDAEQPVSSAVIDAPRSHGVRPAAWSQREEVCEELAA